MTLTKWLCKTFDKAGKGYVKVGDVWHIIPIGIFGTIITCLYFHGLYNCLWNGFKPTSISTPLNDASFIWFYGITTIIICAAFMGGLVYLEDVKIATCERIDADEEEE